MNFLKLRLAPVTALAFVIAVGLASQTRPISSQEAEQQPPAAGEQAAPAEGGGEPPAPAETPPAEAAPDGSTAAPSEPAPETGGATTEAPAAAPEAPAAAAEPTPSEGGPAISASQVPIGASVFGADGAKIGEVNGVKSDDTGKVQEILVTDGVPAGMNAKVFEITADKITSVSDGVKLSLSSEEAKKLPIIDNSNG